MKKLVGILAFFLWGCIGALGNERNLDLDNDVTKDKYIQEIYCHPEQRQKSYQMLKDMVDVFNDYDLPYAILFGTLLGAHRHKGMIPWDDDVDVGISVDDLAKLITLGPIFEGMGYILKIDGQGLVGMKLEDRKSYTSKFSDGSTVTYRPFIDFFLYQKSGDKYTLLFEKGRNFFPRAWFTHKEFETRRLYDFGPLTVMGLNSVEPLNRQYGPHWSSHAVYYFSHSRAVPIKLRWTLRDKDKTTPDVLPLEERYQAYKNQRRDG